LEALSYAFFDERVGAEAAQAAAGRKGGRMTGPRDIHEYLAEFDDIPGTRVFTAKRARQGYHLNQFAMSLMKPENRERWKANERAYLDEWPMSEEQKQAMLDRDYNRLLDLGGNIYFLAKVFSTDGKSFVQAVSTMSGMSLEDYMAMMIAGGRSPEGQRSIKDKR
jgi:protocatechuate 4,5-dioxygenase alpha chain